MRKDDLAHRLFTNKDYFTGSFINKVNELEEQLYGGSKYGWYSSIVLGYLEHLEKCIVAMKEEAAKINQKSNDEWEEECIKVMDDSGNVHRVYCKKDNCNA